MNITQMKDSGYQLLEVISGSHLYGLNLPTSDIDVRGIFNLPIAEYILPDHPKQLNDDMNDEVHYEISRFLTLAGSANPNILEIMFAPNEFIKVKSDKIDVLLRNKHQFLTKACRDSLGGYAITQIRKARGMNKKIVSPYTERKTPIDFCYFLQRDYGTIGFKQLLDLCNMDESDIGLSKINNFYDSYVVYSKKLALRRCFMEKDKQEIIDWIPLGVNDGSESDIKLTSIPLNVAAYGVLGIMHFNRSGFGVHCKEYLSYTEWVKHRNPVRYENNVAHGKGYDSKNMMHCFRLLNMGIELAETGELNVHRKDREYLLEIREGKMDYDDLITKAEEKVIQMDEAFKKCGLPESVPQKLIKEILSEIKLG